MHSSLQVKYDIYIPKIAIFTKSKAVRTLKLLFAPHNVLIAVILMSLFDSFRPSYGELWNFQVFAIRAMGRLKKTQSSEFCQSL